MALKKILVSGISLALTTLSLTAMAGELSGNISLEGRYFPNNGAFLGQQKAGGLSFSFQPEYKQKWDNDHKQLTVSPFYRWDNTDKKRTHADIRQLDFVMDKGDWEFQAGIGKVFWGVTESQHLVDIINQTDAVEGLTNEKLGQPMFRVSRLLDNGSMDFFVLPYFKERTFPGVKGRFRPALAVDTKAATFEDSKDKEKHVDYAVRWANTYDAIDVGVSAFKGTSRDPILNVVGGSIVPHYPQITQLGLDLQYTGEDTIWKLEALNRNFKNSAIKDYTAAVGGLEYAMVIEALEGDLSLLAEYHYDSRGDVPSAPLQNDVFLGARYTFNDENSSEVLAGTFLDLENNAKSYSVSASRRVGKGLKLNLEAKAFEDGPFKKDDFLQLELQKFF